MTGKDRLTFQTLANKRNRIARANAKLAHEHLVELSRATMEIINMVDLDYQEAMEAKSDEIRSRRLEHFLKQRRLN